MSYLDPYQRDLAIRTLYGEADGDASAEAVAHSIRNRQIAGRYGGSNVEGVVNKPYAYEARQPGSEARKRMDSLNPDSEEYRRNAEIVDKVWSGNTPDPTNGATHFLAPKLQSDLGRPRPSWAPEGGGQMHGTQEFFAPEGRVARPDDAEGPPEAPKAPMSTVFSARSRPQPQPPRQAPAPALSTQNVMGGGALSPGAEPPAPKGPAWLEELKNRSMGDWGRTLQQAGMYASDSPQVRAAAAAMQTRSAKKYEFMNHEGQLIRTNAADGTAAPVIAGSPQVDPSIIGKLGESAEKYGQMLNTSKRAAEFSDAIADKSLDVSLVNKGRAAWENLWGEGSEKTQKYNQFQAFTQELVNNVLLQHKGVQTEGDAQRAANQFAAGLAKNDNNAVQSALERLIELNGSATATGRRNLEPYETRYRGSPVLSPFAKNFEEQQKFYTGRAARRNAPPAAPAASADPGLAERQKLFNSFFK